MVYLAEDSTREAVPRPAVLGCVRMPMPGCEAWRGAGTKYD